MHTSASVTSTNWWGIWTLAVGVFAMVTVEELPIGVLTWVADDLGATHGVVGLSVTAAGGVGAIASMVAPLAMRSVDRRLVLMGALALMSVACIGSAVSPSVGWLLFSRLFVGASIGVFWTVAPLVALRMSTPDDAGKATALVFGGAGVATILGVPIGAFIASLLHWRGAFLALAIFGLVNAVVVWAIVPATAPVTDRLRMSAYGRVLREPLVLTGVVMVFVLALAQYSTLTYASPILQDLAGVPGRLVGAFLFVAGLAGLGGNASSGMSMRVRPLTTLFAIPVLLAGALALVVPLAHGTVGTLVVMVCWGFAGSTLASGIQGWINRASPESLEPATGFMTSAFNVAIASGAGAGGYVVDTVGLEALPPAAALVALSALIPYTWYRLTNNPK